jgi:alpha-glucosidase
MLKLSADNGTVSLAFNGRTVFEHTSDKPFITVGYQSLAYRSVHGNFQVTEVGKSKRQALSDCEVNGNRAVFKSAGIYVGVSAAERNGGIELTFDSSDNFCNISFEFKRGKEESVFGGGEQSRKLDLKGEKVINFVSEHIKVKPIVMKLLLGRLYRTRKHSEIDTYSPLSTFVFSDKYALRLDVSGYGVNDFTKENSRFTYWELPKRILYFASDSFKELSKMLNNDAPSTEYLPDWTYDGMILGVQGGIERAVQKAEKMQSLGAEISGIWCQDWSGRKVTAAGKQVYWNWEADAVRYKDLKNRIAELKTGGVRFLGYINPYLIKDGPMYCYCRDKGYLIKNDTDEVYHVKSTTFDAGMLDLTNPDAAKYLKDIIIKKNMLDLGISGYMADFGEYLPVDCKLYSGDPKKLHNAWPVIWARLNREAVAESGLENEVFFFTRSGYNGAQSHTAIMWNGDQHTDFSADYGMPSVIPASINLGLSGVTAVHSDIAGFISFGALRRDSELFIRWMEMNVFSPLMRTHETIRPENNAQYDDSDVAAHCVTLTKVHKILKPYIKACMLEAQSGIPVMRAPFYEFNDMSEYKNDYVYMFGSDIFVAPVLKRGAVTQEIELPKGEWVRFSDGKKYSEGKHTVNVPLGNPAAFYKKDSAYSELFSKATGIFQNQK